MYTDLDTLRKILQVAHSREHRSFRRMAFVDSILAVYAVVHGTVRMGRALDDVLYPGYQQQPLGEPIYIVAAPRSGTTFLHRLLALDPQFTTFKLYQTILPALTLYRAAERIGQVNGQLGDMLTALQARIDTSSFGGWDGIHKTGLGHDEEDEGLFVHAMASPAVMLLLPFAEEFEHLRFLDSWTDERRARLVSYYRSCLQRHLFHHPGKTLLAKNVLLPGRFEIVREAVPGARFVHVLRHPYEVLPSMLSLFTAPWRLHSPEIPLDGPEVQAMASLAIDYYRYLHARSEESAARGDGRFFTVTYRDLLSDPVDRVRSIYEFMKLEMSSGFEQALVSTVAAQRGYSSVHAYSLAQFGLDRAQVYEAMPEIFARYDFDQ